jgi:hypothetical protein
MCIYLEEPNAAVEWLFVSYSNLDSTRESGRPDSLPDPGIVEWCELAPGTLLQVHDQDRHRRLNNDVRSMPLSLQGLVAEIWGGREQQQPQVTLPRRRCRRTGLRAQTRIHV